MENMISGRPSFYEDFKEDRISGSELFNTVGGIERSIVESDDTLDRSAFDPMMNIKFADNEMFPPIKTKMFPLKTIFFLTVRFFRTL